MNDTPIHVCAKTVLVDFQVNIGKLVLSITSSPSIIILENASVYRKNVIMVTLASNIMFFLFTCMHFWVGGNFTKVVCVCTDHL
jgi:hypothetical protein